MSSAEWFDTPQLQGSWGINGFCQEKNMHVLFGSVELDLFGFILPPLISDFLDPSLVLRRDLPSSAKMRCYLAKQIEPFSSA